MKNLLYLLGLSLIISFGVLVIYGLSTQCEAAVYVYCPEEYR